MFVDVPLAVAYILSVATVAANWPRALRGSCVAKVAGVTGVPGENILDADCATLKGAFGILIIEMLTFHGAIIWDAIVMSRNPNRRRDVRTAAQNYMPVMPKPMAASSGTNGQYQLDGTPVYPAELASPAAQYNPDMPSTDPQQQQYQQYQQNRGPPQELSGTC